jgi:hypothetical protein
MAQQDATTTVRTTVRDAVLTDVSADCDSDSVDVIEDVTVSSTERAALNAAPLLDFDEYSEVSL